MKLTVEHAIIGVVALALIYYIVQHRNLLNKHIDLKVVQGKHYERDYLTNDELEKRAKNCSLTYLKSEGKLGATHYACSNAQYQSGGDIGNACNPWWKEITR